MSAEPTSAEILRAMYARDGPIHDARYDQAAALGQRTTARKEKWNGDDDVVVVPRGESALALLERPMIAIAFNVDPWIPEGLCLTVGRPKLGKSTLARQKLAAVAGGGELFGVKATQAKCAFLSLEENDRQTRHKFELANFPREALAHIMLFFNWKRGADGVLQIARLLDDESAIKYVVVDSLTRFRSVPDARTLAFSADYEAVSALQSLCKTRPGVTIECIHHTRKAKGDDPLDDISGTYGLSAAADSYAVMRHHEDGAVLHVGGRLWSRDDSSFQLRRANQRWELVGEFSPLTQIQRDTLEQLRISGGQTPTEAAKFWGLSRQTMMDRFGALVKHGVVFSKDGVYRAK